MEIKYMQINKKKKTINLKKKKKMKKERNVYSMHFNKLLIMVGVVNILKHLASMILFAFL